VRHKCRHMTIKVQAPTYRYDAVTVAYISVFTTNTKVNKVDRMPNDGWSKREDLKVNNRRDGWPGD